METNASMLVSIVVMVGVMVALIVDLLRARRARARRAAMRPETVIARTPRPEPVTVSPVVAAAPVVHTWSAPRPVPSTEPDPIRELAERLAALRLLGLDHVKTHPLFRMPAAMASAAVSTPAVVLAPPPPSAPVRPRRARRPSGMPRPTTTLRLVVDRA